jgi:hypothetical protein
MDCSPVHWWLAFAFGALAGFWLAMVLSLIILRGIERNAKNTHRVQFQIRRRPS